jgi:hypothetical protein
MVRAIHETKVAPSHVEKGPGCSRGWAARPDLIPLLVDRIELLRRVLDDEVRAAVPDASATDEDTNENELPPLDFRAGKGQRVTGIAASPGREDRPLLVCIPGGGYSAG